MPRIGNHNLTHDVAACFCPNCGRNLRQSERLTYGPIGIDERGGLWFDGQAMPLARCPHLIVDVLVQAKGRGLTRAFLATSIGGEIYDQTISEYIQRTRDSFRQIEPGFKSLRCAASAHTPLEDSPLIVDWRCKPSPQSEGMEGLPGCPLRKFHSTD